MKKNLLIAAIAITALASCTSNDYVGDQSPQGSNETNGAINFNLSTAAVTRATGADAATALGNQFIVYGEKSETADGAAPVTDGSTSHQLVFKNYVVKYTGNSAYTTTSNTKDWEYVGLSQTYGTNVTPQAGETQTIKYWDYSASNYVFTAVSALVDEINSGYVKITKITEKTDGNKVYDKGYSVELTANATVSKLYFSDRQVISQGTGTDRTATNAYGGNVTLTFRNTTSQIRVGMYETIPGYSVKIKKFYYQDNASPAFASMSSEVTSNFTANVPNLATGSAATLTVTYYNEGTRVNQPKISVSGSPANFITLTGSGLAADVTLATSASSPTYDNSGNFTTVFPQEANNKSLKLKVDYQLVNTTTGETINVNGATAEIPANYLQWKPNFKYTYLFKISDNTNGSTGGSVVGLYPITFDAVEVTDENGSAEYITTVSAPTITTFGVSSTGAYVTGESDYAAGSDIYATFTEGSTVKTPVLGTSGEYHVNVYKVTTSDATNFPITEASVAEAIANPGRIIKNVYTCTVTDVTEKAAADLSDATTYYKKDANNKAPGDDGYVPTLAVENTDYTIGADSEQNTITGGVMIYTCTVTYSEVTDVTTLAAGTNYYKSDGTHNPGDSDYVPTIAVEGADYIIAPKIKATNITTSTSTDYFTDGTEPTVVDAVPGENGVNKTIKAVKLTGVKAGTYAIEYEASTNWTGAYKKVYKVIVVQ